MTYPDQNSYFLTPKKGIIGSSESIQVTCDHTHTHTLATLFNCFIKYNRKIKTQPKVTSADIADDILKLVINRETRLCILITNNSRDKHMDRKKVELEPASWVPVEDCIITGLDYLR